MSNTPNESYKPDDAEAVKQLWLDYKTNPTPAKRDAILAKYEYIPRTIAYQFARKKPHVLDVDDLIQAGRMGLWQAMQRYDLTMNVKFNTYATIRVRGSILDLINKVDWTPRPIRESIKKVIRAIEASGGGLSVSDDENFDVHQIASFIEDMTPEEVQTTLYQMKKTYVSHIDKNAMSSIELNVIGAKEDYAALHVILNTVLDMKERQVIELKFFGGYKDYEIVKYLKITQHQLNQIEKRALGKLERNLTTDLF